MTDIRDEFIRRVVKGKTFADVGGLWGTVNEKVSVAYNAGASKLSMLDVAPDGDPLWIAFARRLYDMRKPDAAAHEITLTPGDVQEYAENNGDAFDVVHCSGVLYHAPEPTRLLHALRRITREHLILTSTIVPNAAVREAGHDGWLYIPALGPETKKLLAEHWKKVLGPTQAIGITAHCEWNPADFAPWWWLPTVEGMKRRCESVGFTIVDEAPFWDGNAHTLLLKA